MERTSSVRSRVHSLTVRWASTTSHILIGFVYSRHNTHAHSAAAELAKRSRVANVGIRTRRSAVSIAASFGQDVRTAAGSGTDWRAVNSNEIQLANPATTHRVAKNTSQSTT